MQLPINKGCPGRCWCRFGADFVVAATPLSLLLPRNVLNCWRLFHCWFFWLKPKVSLKINKQKVVEWEVERLVLNGRIDAGESGEKTSESPGKQRARKKGLKGRSRDCCSEEGEKGAGKGTVGSWNPLMESFPPLVVQSRRKISVNI